MQERRPAGRAPATWTWHATIAANAAFCRGRSGLFEIDFVRVKENSADLQFTRTFRWTASMFKIAIEMAPDEVITSYRIGTIEPCPCRAVGDLMVGGREP